MDRRDAIFWLCISLGTAWAGSIFALIPNQEIGTAYGIQVIEISTALAVAIGLAGAWLYRLWPRKRDGPLSDLWHSQTDVELFGTPNWIDRHRTRHYTSRDGLPKFDGLFKHFSTIEMLARSFLLTTKQDLTPFEDAINNGKVITLYIQDPESEFSKFRQIDPASKEPSEDIRDALELLIELKGRVAYPENFHIRLFRAELTRSIMILDRNKGNAWISVEEHLKGKFTLERPSQITTMKDNSLFYERYLGEFKSKIENSWEISAWPPSS